MELRYFLLQVGLDFPICFDNPLNFLVFVLQQLLEVVDLIFEQLQLLLLSALEVFVLLLDLLERALCDRALLHLLKLDVLALGHLLVYFTLHSLLLHLIVLSLLLLLLDLLVNFLVLGGDNLVQLVNLAVKCLDLG